ELVRARSPPAASVVLNMLARTKSSTRPAVPQTLLSVASHEIRGPVGVARGYLKLLQRDASLSEASLQAARGASTAVDRIVTLLDEMTEYARLISGDAPLKPSEVSWLDLLNAAAARASLPTAPHLAWRPEPGLADLRVVADRDRMEAALATLIEALSRAQATDATLAAAVASSSGSGGTVLDLFVEENGEVSWCAADTARGGLGFSLFVADAVIAAHGGRLTERWQAGHWTGYRIV